MPRARAESVGIDIGGTLIKLGCIGADGRVIESDVLPTPADPVEAPGAIARALGGLDAPGRPIGAACAGLIDRTAGIVVASPNLPRWEDFPLAARLSAALESPVTLVNDANAFGFAEARLGAGRGYRLVIVLTLGTGIGGGIVEDGRIRDGVNGFAAEPGHMTIDRNGLPCACGGRGCLERYASGRAIVENAQAGIHSGQAGAALVRRAAGGVTPLHVHEAACDGDPFAARILAEAGEALGVGLVNLVNLFDPDVVVVGGGVALAGDSIFGPARAVLASHSMIGRRRMPALLPAALGDAGGLVGAALLALEGGGGGP
jgi:glucokinase